MLSEDNHRRYHIAVINTSGYGHVIPTLDLTAELVRRGHRVTYVTAGGPVKNVATTGADVLEYDSKLPDFDLAELDSVHGQVLLPAITLRESEAILRAVTGHFTADRPDAVLFDVTVYHAGRILARRLGVPGIASSPVLLSNEHFSLTGKMVELSGRSHPRRHPALVEFTTGLIRLLAEHGQSDVSLDEFFREVTDLNIAYFPKSFQFAGETFDRRYQFVGPAVAGGLAAGEWEPPGDGRPILAVSLGTACHRRPGFYRALLDAVRPMPWHVVLGLHDGMDIDQLGPKPDNVEVHRWVPAYAVLRHADVFVCHGGMGSLMAAMYRDTPVVVVPTSLEAMANAQRVEQLGLGRTVHADRLTADQLRDAVLDVAADQGVRQQVQAMHRDIVAAGGGATGADVIEAHLRSV